MNAQDKDGNTPLHMTKVAEVAQALLAAGADASLRSHRSCTALEVALGMQYPFRPKPQVAAIIRAHQGISDGPLANPGTSSFALPGVSAPAIPDVSEAAAPGASVPAPELPPASAEPSSDDAVRDALARMSRVRRRSPGCPVPSSIGALERRGKPLLPLRVSCAGANKTTKRV